MSTHSAATLSASTSAVEMTVFVFPASFSLSVALRLCAAGEHELRKQAVILTALLNGDLCNAAAANDQ